MWGLESRRLENEHVGHLKAVWVSEKGLDMIHITPRGNAWWQKDPRCEDCSCRALGEAVAVAEGRS